MTHSPRSLKGCRDSLKTITETSKYFVFAWFGTRPYLNPKILHALLLAICMSFTPAAAQTRQECELAIKKNTIIAGHAGAGAVAAGTLGTFGGAAACSGLLGFALLDFGISYGVCITMVAAAATTAGTVVGTGAGEDAVIAEEQKCLRLSEK